MWKTKSHVNVRKAVETQVIAAMQRQGNDIVFKYMN